MTRTSEASVLGLASHGEDAQPSCRFRVKLIVRFGRVRAVALGPKQGEAAKCGCARNFRSTRRAPFARCESRAGVHGDTDEKRRSVQVQG